jgi:hypothetical protein
MYKVNPNQTGINNALTKLRDVMLYDTSMAAIKQTQPQVVQQQPQTQPQPVQIQTQPVQIQPQPVQMQTQPVQIQTQNENVFRPALNQDPLFWCLYIMMHGAFKYEQLANRFTAEQDGKRDQIMMLREKGKPLKQSTGIKFTASTIEGDITSQRMSLQAFHVLVRLNSLNAVFVNPGNRVYAEFISDAVADKPTYVIERNDKNPKCMTMTKTNGPFSTSYHRIENPMKPIKSASSYTVAELTELCHQLKIQLKPKMKKQELYDAVSAQLVL